LAAALLMRAAATEVRQAAKYAGPSGSGVEHGTAGLSERGMWDALDEGLEYAVYDLVRTELPNTILVSVSHRPSVERHHRRHLELLGEGAWRLGGVEPAAPVTV
jgi:hypothetical protein